MSEIAKGILSGLKKSPQHLVILAIVGGFLWYLFRKDSMELDAKKQIDLVSKQRIDHCHSIQEDATRVMDRLNETLNNHDKAFAHLLYKLDRFLEMMDKTHSKIDALMAKLTLLELYIKENEPPHKDMTEILKQIMIEIEVINKKIKED